MSLRDQFAADLDAVFMNASEFATVREFRISNGLGGFTVFSAPVVWDEEAANKQPLVAQFGVYMGEVVCYIASKYLPRIPVAGELIYSPANRPWEVLKAIDEEGGYKLSLSATRSQPGYYAGGAAG